MMFGLLCVPLKEIFNYSVTVAEVNYPEYLAYTGLLIATVTKSLPGLTMGAEVAYSLAGSSFMLRNVLWPSSACNAGLKKGDKIIAVDGMKASQQIYDSLMATKHHGDHLQIQTEREKQTKTVTVTLSVKYEKNFSITPMDRHNALQSAIYKNWLR